MMTLFVVALLLPGAAVAQGIGGRGRSGNGPSAPQGGPPAAPRLPTTARLPWPRLDPGAVVCRTRDDLRLHAEVIQARADGTTYAGAFPDCRVIDVAVPIDILTRESPAATEVKLKEKSATTGWTDTWLPTQPPR